MRERDIEPEVLREMTIEELKIPKEWKRYVSEENLKNLSSGTKLILLTMSELEDQLRFCLTALVQMNSHMRVFEEELVRQRILQRNTQSSVSWQWSNRIKWNLAQWVAALIAGAVLIKAVDLIFSLIKHKP